MTVALTVDGRQVEIRQDGVSLLDALRDELGLRSPKDGCSPQGQCGCCTVLVDGSPRVASVTAVRRVAGRAVTTADGLDPEIRTRLTEAFVDSGASQCGFCTPGILCRLASLGTDPTPARVESALLAHLCRCPGWRTVVEAATRAGDGPTLPRGPRAPRDLVAAARRASLEGGVAQRVGPDIVSGAGGFADDTAPREALVAVPDGAGGWAIGETLSEARAAAGKVQGRRSGQPVSHPLDPPPGDWALTLQTAWVEPAYLEPDASWCAPGGQPASPLANGGAFGAKTASPAPAAARRLADHHRRPVRVVLSREDVVLQGVKRPPMAAGVRPDGTGVVRLARCPAAAAAIKAFAPGLEVVEVDLAGPVASGAVRGAGWAEAAVLVVGAVARGAPTARRANATVTSPAGGRAEAVVDVDELGLPTSVEVSVACGDPLDEVVLRSYVTGAAHMALGWVCSEGLGLDEGGQPVDLTIRSFGILRAKDTPAVTVHVETAGGPPVNGSDAAFAAVAAATWIAQGLPPAWPTIRGAFK
ncbi:MAG: 2Fe-2S iron-sulfur cluster-binding protein [Acidimicrobiales bacterium]